MTLVVNLLQHWLHISEITDTTNNDRYPITNLIIDASLFLCDPVNSYSANEFNNDNKRKIEYYTGIECTDLFRDT